MVIQCNKLEVRRMTLTVKMADSESALIKDYAKLKGKTVSDVLRKAVISYIENEIDTAAYEQAYAEYQRNPVTHTLDEVEKEILAK